MSETTVKLIPLSPTNYHHLRIWRNRHRHLFTDDRYVTPAIHRHWFASYRQDPHQHQYLVHFRSRPIGTLGIITTDPAKPEVGRLILGDRRLKRRGLMSQAMQLLFKKHPAPRYQAVVLKNNPAALRFNLKNSWIVVKEDASMYYIEHPGIENGA